MINVLPREHKNALKKEFFSRATIVALLMLSCIGIIFTLLLVPSYLLITTKASATEEKLAGLKELFASTGTPLTSDTVAKINSTLTFFAVDEPEITPAQLIDFVLDTLPTTILIDQINISKVEKSYQIILTGFALNREALLGFSGELKKDPRIVDVVLPLSSFVANQNLQFSITITTK